MASKSAHLLVLAVVFLAALGVVILSSTSVYSSIADDGDPYHYVKRQALWLAVGAIACFALGATDYHWLKKLAVPGYVLAIVLLALCFVPGIGHEINGARRWIGIHGVLPAFQPSEFARLAAIVLLAAWYADRDEEVAGTFLEGFVQPLLLVGVLVALIGLEVDLGAAALLCAVAGIVVFLAGCRALYIGVLAGAGVAGLAYAVTMIPNRIARFLAFLDLEAHRTELGLQQWRSLLAFGSGGLWGCGLGNGRQKMAFLPYSDSDFIFPMVGEELGLVFTLPVVLAFVVILGAGAVIALHAPDRFGRLLAIGITVAIAIQAALNIGVVTAVLPNKGLPLPFVSKGGSNLLCCFVGVGILINIFRQGRHVRDERFPKIVRAKVTPRL